MSIVSILRPFRDAYKTSVFVKPEFDGFFQDVLDRVRLDALQLPARAKSRLRAGGEFGANASTHRNADRHRSAARMWPV